MTQQTSNRDAPRRNDPARPKGPIATLFGLGFGLVLTVLTSWIFATLFEVIGMHTVWKGQGADHARNALIEDYSYIRTFPKSLLVDDTEEFARKLGGFAVVPFHAIRAAGLADRVAKTRGASQLNERIDAFRVNVGSSAAEWIEASMYCAEDTMVRLAIAFYGIPAFAMALCLGFVDGLVRRDLRKWSGGRESSFVYHHAKRFSAWFLGFGFAAYLVWPFGGVNPAHLLLLFVVAVAVSTSTTISSFKKYL
ncbi:TIGR03747 family integrating conjugative element membrane protein [Nitrogeniibacter aestuarii]|uniref:TIGR03747 family integrating conjugative element membrane protein n=1 Tax=Nitrogeniibacter aestuarii TaxID=2815343 RepID=UPI001E409F1C|nr:TIGR03747 family integrating conjugative element membrane protein [Nitrogeniibacter aestuarii]